MTSRRLLLWALRAIESTNGRPYATTIRTASMRRALAAAEEQALCLDCGFLFGWRLRPAGKEFVRTGGRAPTLDKDTQGETS